MFRGEFMLQNKARFLFQQFRHQRIMQQMYADIHFPSLHTRPTFTLYRVKVRCTVFIRAAISEVTPCSMVIK